MLETRLKYLEIPSRRFVVAKGPDRERTRNDANEATKLFASKSKHRGCDFLFRRIQFLNVGTTRKPP